MGVLDIPDGEGWTPLHWAVNLKNAKFVQYLLVNGANPDEQDYEGVTPRDLAKASPEIADIIKEFRPFVETQNIGECAFFGFCGGNEHQQLPSKKRKH